MDLYAPAADTLIFIRPLLFADIPKRGFFLLRLILGGFSAWNEKSLNSPRAGCETDDISLIFHCEGSK